MMHLLDEERWFVSTFLFGIFMDIHLVTVLSCSSQDKPFEYLKIFLAKAEVIVEELLVGNKGPRAFHNFFHPPQMRQILDSNLPI